MANHSNLFGAAFALFMLNGHVVSAQNRIVTETDSVKTEMSSDGRFKVLIEMRDNQPWASIEDSRQAGTFNCKGRSVSVAGRENKLTLAGECPFVDVSGNGNQLLIEASDHISVAGRDNKVEWRRGVSGPAPEIGNAGRGNRIGKASGN